MVVLSPGENDVVKNIARALGFVVFVAAWTPFLACDVLPIDGLTDNTNDNATDNTNDNTTDNANDNAADNTNDNTTDNANDNTTDNTNDNV